MWKSNWRQALYSSALLALSGCGLVVNGAADTEDQPILIVTAQSQSLARSAGSVNQVTSTLAVPRYDHTATVLPDGRLLVVGGDDGSDDVLSSVEIFDPSANDGVGGWIMGPSLHAPRERHTAQLMQDGRVLIVGGSNELDGTLNTAEIFDPNGDEWLTLPQMNFNRVFHTTSLLNDGRVLVVGGADGPALNSVEIFDPSVEGGNSPWSLTQSLNTARYHHTATVLPDGRVLVVGGQGGNTGSVEIYDPTYETNEGLGAWSVHYSLITGRYEHAASLLPDGRVMIIGGNGGGVGSSVEIYDPLENSGFGVSITGPFMSEPRGKHTATQLENGKVLVLGGYNGDNGTTLSLADLFDPSAGNGAGEWTALEIMPNARYSHTASLIPDGRVIAVGGYRSTALTSVDIFDPETPDNVLSNWVNTDDLYSARAHHTSTVLADGRLLVTGGDRGTNDLSSSVQIFDPAVNQNAGEWSAAASLNYARAYHTASLLGDGRALIVGGRGVTLPNSVEIFDPNANLGTGQWTMGPAPAKLRFQHTASVLPDGRLIIAGGENVVDGLHESTEIFDPSADLGAGDWQYGPDLNTARSLHTAVVLADGRVMVIGGDARTGGILASVEIFNPAANSGQGEVTEGPSLNVARHSHTAGLLADGRVLVAGGSNGTALDSVEIFDPTASAGAGAWTMGPDLGAARRSHSMNVFADGRVMVSGGFDANDELLSSMEIFETAVGSWSGELELPVAVANLLSTTLLDGRILVHGGSGLFGAEDDSTLFSLYETTVITIEGSGTYTTSFDSGAGTLYPTENDNQMVFMPKVSGLTKIRIVDVDGRVGTIEINVQ